MKLWTIAHQALLSMSHSEVQNTMRERLILAQILSGVCSQTLLVLGISHYGLFTWGLVCLSGSGMRRTLSLIPGNIFSFSYFLHFWIASCEADAAFHFLDPSMCETYI